MALKRLFMITLLQAFFSPLWGQIGVRFHRLSIEALRGSCVLLPCTFRNPEPRRAPEELLMDWYRAPGFHTLIYSAKRPGEVSESYRGRTEFKGDLKNDDCSLQINNVKTEDAAEYYPWIHPLTSSFDVYTVRVSDTPKEPLLTDPGEMTEGRPVKLKCSVDHTCPTKPPTLAWVGHSNTASVYHESLKDGEWKTVSEITYYPMSGNHMTSLQCMAYYTETITSKRSITMNIRYPPKNTMAVVQGNSTVKEGDSATLTCTGVGNPEIFNYSWYEGQQEGVLRGHSQQITLENLGGDSGPYYYCTAKNEVGTGSSAPLKLTIQHAPKGTHVKSPLQNLIEGGRMNLECETNSSDPKVDYYSWYKDGSQLQNQSAKTLSIKDMTPAHSGDYHCEAHNSIGRSSSANFTVEVLVPVSAQTLEKKSFVAIGCTLGLLLLLTLVVIYIFLKSNKKKKKEPALQRTSVQQNAPEDILYAALDLSNNRRTQRRAVPADDFVTYAALKRNSNSDQQGPACAEEPDGSSKNEVVYATGLKFHRPTPYGQERHNDDFVEYAAVR